jgi:hypothetical protein
MTATTASDPSGVQYYFDCTAGAGGHDSAWQSSATYQDTGLTPSTQYSYQVRTRDQSANQNTGTWSTTQSATTQAGGGTTVLTDGFETDFNKWTDGGTTDWDRATAQKRTGTYSAHAGSSDNDLISDNLNTAGYASMTIDFYFRDDDIDDDDNIFMQLYNGSAYADKYELGNSAEDTWQHATVTLNNSGGDAAYFISNFRIKFEGTSIDSGENLWIDDVLVTVTGTGGDSTPPTPNPSTWATVPYATGSTSISMTATTASDPSGVQYYFDCTAGAGGHDSVWQSSATYQDTGLTPSTQYSYRIQTRDQSAGQNTGTWSTTLSATTNAGGGANVLTNPGFETGALTPWAYSGSGGSIVSSGAHSGTYAVQLSGDAISVHQNIKPSVVAGVQYTFKAYVRVTTEGTGWGQPRFRASYWPDLGSSDYGEASAQNSIAAGWQLLQFTHTFTQTEIDNAVNGINVGIINFGFTGGVDITDDLEVAAP